MSEQQLLWKIHISKRIKCIYTNYPPTPEELWQAQLFQNVIVKDNDYLSMSVPWRFSRFKPYSESEIGEHCRQVVLQQDIFTLEVPTDKPRSKFGKGLLWHVSKSNCNTL